MKKRLLALLLPLVLSITLCGQSSMRDSISHYFANNALDDSHLRKMTMTTPDMGDYQHVTPDPHLVITTLDTAVFTTTLRQDTSRYKIVLLWSCWSKYGIGQMNVHKELWHHEDYDIYLISADLNNDPQRDIIRRYLSSIGISGMVYQLDAPIALSDLQNSRTIAVALAWLTGQPPPADPANVCAVVPTAIVYDRNGLIVRTLAYRFDFSELERYRR